MLDLQEALEDGEVLVQEALGNAPRGFPVVILVAYQELALDLAGLVYGLVPQGRVDGVDQVSRGHIPDGRRRPREW